VAGRKQGNVKLKIGLSAEQAIVAGVNPGAEATEVDATTLSIEERREIASRLDRDNVLWGPADRTSATVAAWARDQAAARTDETAKKAAARAAATEKWIGSPDEDLIDFNPHTTATSICLAIAHGKPTTGGWGGAQQINLDDPRVAARMPALEALREKRSAQKWEEKRAAEAAEAARQAAEASAKAAAREAAAREIRKWAETHGSARLRRLIVEEISHDAVYRDERLALERPDWVYDNASIRGAASEIRNASEEALALLDEARKTAPDARLVYWVADEETDDEGETIEEFRGAVCVAQFLDRQIVFRPPAEIVRD
jgi:hypothetical protein